MESPGSTEVTTDSVPDDRWGWSIFKTNMVAFSVCPPHIPHDLLSYWNRSSVVKSRDTSQSRARLISIIALSDAACPLEWKKVKLTSFCSCCISPLLDGVQLKHWKPSFVAGLQIIGEDISVTSSHSYHYVRFVPAASYVGLRVYCAWLTEQQRCR
jgi:hypothetical protein